MAQPTLRIAEDLALPLEAVTQTFGILAKRGVGKTYTGAVFAEELLKAGQVVAIVDPVGVWWGLRAAADGNGPGLPITVLGGEHGDLPLAVDSGAAIADLLVEERIPLVLDLSLFRKGEMHRWATAFFERLYHRNREPLQLILDEADEFAPQGKGYGDEPRMLGAVEDLVRRGRARGIGVTLITQRAAVINKNVLTQIEALIVLRTLGPQDRKAIDEWINIHGTPEQRAELMASLGSLPIGEAWFWSPGWLDVFQRVKVRRRETFDSSATPKAGQQRAVPRELAPVDLERLQQRFADSLERAKAEDPKVLRAEIADLKRQLAARPTETKVEKVLEHVDVPAIPTEVIDDLRDLSANIRRLVECDAFLGLTELRESFWQLVEMFEGAQRDPAGRKRAGPPTPLRAPSRQLVHLAPAVTALHTKRVKPDAAPPTTPEGSTRVSAPQQRILDALASFEAIGLDALERGNVAVFSNASATSSGFANNLGTLRTTGLVDYPAGGRVALTDAGRALAGPPMPIASTAQLHDAWYAKLSAPQTRILQALVEVYPEPVAREELAARSLASATSSGYANNLGTLRSLGLLEYPSRGAVVATALLFPEGLPR